ncbi:flagellar hook-basal body complex protein FliE [Massilia glaciei]
MGGIGGIGAIDGGRIEAMIAQLKAAAAKPGGGVEAGAPAQPAGKVDFADALKASLEQVSANQIEAGELGKRFTAGDNAVSLSDAMIAMQKASIGFQATVQVRNKLVSAYHEIMNMQV